MHLRDPVHFDRVARGARNRLSIGGWSQHAFVDRVRRKDHRRVVDSSRPRAFSGPAKAATKVATVDRQRQHLVALGDDQIGRSSSQTTAYAAIVAVRANHGRAGLRDRASLHGHRRRRAELNHITRLDAGRDRDKHRPARRVRLELAALGDAARDRHLEHGALGEAERTLAA